MLKRFLNILVVIFCLSSVLYSQQLLSTERSELLMLLDQLEQNSNLREKKIKDLESRLIFYKENERKINEELKNLRIYNRDLIDQIVYWKNSDKIMNEEIETLKSIYENLKESNEKIEKQLIELEKYYKKKIVEVALISGGVGILIGTGLTILFYSLTNP